MRIKIRGGTSQGDSPSLCLSCKRGKVIRGETLDEEIIECDSLASQRARIKFKVTSCSEYLNSTHPTIREMESIAWVVRTDKKKGAIGFVPLEKLTRAERTALKPLVDSEDW